MGHKVHTVYNIAKSYFRLFLLYFMFIVLAVFLVRERVKIELWKMQVKSQFIKVIRGVKETEILRLYC